MQHQAGRHLTDQITLLATAASLKDASSVAQLRDAMRQFDRMYSPLEAREDTVLFPAHQLFGEDRFEKMVERVASIEMRLGIYDLAQFTPRV